LIQPFNLKTKLQPFSYWLISLALPLAFYSPNSTSFAQGTAITYQGRLFDGANPANGK
jgi:hypothetical protein